MGPGPCPQPCRRMPITPALRSRQIQTQDKSGGTDPDPTSRGLRKPFHSHSWGRGPRGEGGGAPSRPLPDLRLLLPLGSPPFSRSQERRGGGGGRGGEVQEAERGAGGRRRRRRVSAWVAQCGED